MILSPINIKNRFIITRQIYNRVPFSNNIIWSAKVCYYEGFKTV